MTPRDLEARIATLERRLAALSGPMVSQQSGATSLRPWQVGLPVEITGVYNSSTGYPWKACVLDTTLSSNQVKSDSALPTGKFAYTPDNDTSLTATTRGWLEPDPQGRGFLFVKGGTSSSSTVISWKNVVRAATAANGTLSTAFANGQVVDGVTLVTGDRILVKNQTAAADNGIYTVNASGPPTRATDADDTNEMVGAVVLVSEGTANGQTIWKCDQPAVVAPGTTATSWTKIFPTTYATGKTSGATTVTTAATWTDVGLTVTLPTAGTYLVTTCVDFSLTSFTNGIIGSARIKASGTVQRTWSLGTGEYDNASVDYGASGTGTWSFVCAAGTAGVTLKVEVEWTTGGAPTLPSLVANAVEITAVRLTP